MLWRVLSMSARSDGTAALGVPAKTSLTAPRCCSDADSL
jgi:hypothetical protein